MESLLKGCGCFFVLVFVLLVGALILTWSLRDGLLDAGTWVDAFERAGLFELPYELIGEGETPDLGRDLLTQGPLAALDYGDLEAVARDLAPPDWLREQVRNTLQTNLDQLGERENFDVLISVRQVKERALGVPGDRALQRVVDELPVCPPGQDPFQMSLDTPLCRPPDLDLSPFLGTLKAYLVPYVDQVPDTWRVKVGPRNEEITRDLRRVRQVLDRVEAGLPVALGGVLGLLILIWLLAVRSMADWLRWTGGALLLAGGLVALVAWLVPRVVAWQVERGVFWTDGDLPVRLRQAISQVPGELLVALFQTALLVGLALGAVGLLLALASLLFPPRRRQEVPAIHRWR